MSKGCPHGVATHRATTVLEPCGCTFSRCLECARLPLTTGITVVNGNGTHTCGHTAPITKWRTRNGGAA